MPTKRVSITRYQMDYFEEGSAPTRNTIINWIKGGHLAGEQLGPSGKKGGRGGNWYVYPDRPPITSQGDEKFKSLLVEFENEALSYGNGKAA